MPTYPYHIPQVLTFTLADRVIKDNFTGQWSAINVVTQLHAHGFPADIDGLHIFMEFSDGRGQTPIDWQIVDAEQERAPVATGSVTLNIAPLDYTYYQRHTGPLTFYEPGDYRFTMTIHDHRWERRIVVAPLEPPKPEGTVGSSS
jgi:hypothetical protein